MELNDTKEFKSTPKLTEQLKSLGFMKSFKDGEVKLNANAGFG